MTQEVKPKRTLIKQESIPTQFPTHRHDSLFWESLGRTVATFGYLEKTLGQAIYAFLMTKPYDASQIDEEFMKWLAEKLEDAVTDPLGKLITEYKKAVESHPEATATGKGFDDLIAQLRTASSYRNALCHGAWDQVPDENGASVPFFVNNWDKLVFDIPINHHFLDKLQRNVAYLICEVMNTVTHMGWQFPGSTGPGTPIVSDI